MGETKQNNKGGLDAFTLTIIIVVPIIVAFLAIIGANMYVFNKTELPQRFSGGLLFTGCIITGIIAGLATARLLYWVANKESKK